MALVVADRVKETTTSVGTSTINLAGAEDNFETFVAGVGTGNTTYYAIVDKGNSEFEVGIGTVTSGTPDTLSRDTVLASSNSDALVNFSTGEKDVFCTQPADRAVYLDSSGQLVIDGTSVTATATELNYVDGVTSAIQTQLDSKLNLSGGTMTGALTLSGAPTADNHATTKIYVDELIAAGIHYHDPVRVESPDSAGSLTATYNNGTNGVGATLTNNGTQAALVIDGVTLATSDRVLIYNQTNAFENGIYTVTDTGSASTNWVLTRATDADSYGVDNQSLSEGTSIFVLEGTDGSGEVYACTTTGTITFGTTAINFSQIGRSAVITGNGGITVTGNEISANVNATVQTTGANSVTSTASRTYAVQVDGSNDLVVNVPWVDTDTNTDTTYTAGTGLTLSGTQFSVQDNYVLNSGDSIAGQLSVTSSVYPPLEVTRDAGAVTTGNYGSLKLNTITSGTPAAGLGSYAGFFVDDVGKGSVGFENDGSFHILNASDADIVTVSSTGNITVAGTVDGRDIAADGTKLDGIESGATADQSASEILTAIKTVDGSGSGLDADLIDGVHGPFVKENGTDFNGQYPLVVRTSANVIYSNAGIQYTGSTDTLDVSGSINIAGHRVLTVNDEGSGNGLDADTVDSLHASSFIRNDTSNSVTNYANKVTFFSNTNAATTSSSQASLECYSSGAGNDAFMAFHVGGDYATYFGLDGDTNDLFVGGWSKGASRYKIWHAGNDGTGSGLDADLLDGQQGSYYYPASNPNGYTTNIGDITGVTAGSYLTGGGTSGGVTLNVDATTAATASKVVARNSSGDDYRRYGFAEYFNMSHGTATRSSDTIFYSSTDSYIRKTNAAGMRASLSVPTRTGGDASGTWGISITGNADTVDSLHASSFLRSDATDYTNGVIYLRADIRNETGYRDHGVYGNYDSYKINHIWSMGDQYRVPANGSSFGNLYGAAYTYSNRVYTALGEMGGGHQMVWCQNGTPTSAMGTHLWTSGSVYGNIFYDRNNTGYYVDPDNGGFTLRGGSSNRVTYYTNDSGFRVNNPEGNGVTDIRLGAAWGRPGVYSSSQLELMSDSTTGIIFIIDNTEYGRLNTDFFFHTSDIRTPVFYDSNNTAYYGDFASTNSFNQSIYASSTPLRFSTTSTALFNHEGNANPVAFRMNKGGSTLSDGSNFGVLQLSRTNHNNSSTSVGAALYFVLKDSGGTDREYAGIYGRKTVAGASGGELVFMNYGRNELAYLNSDYFSHNSDIRTPVFYDSNNTEYYGDFASTSDAALKIRGGALFGPNTSWASSLLVGGNGRNNYTNNTSVASVCTTNGNLHIDAASGFNTYINFYDGNNVYFGNGANATVAEIASDGTFRSPIFYDYNNTAYYGDFASTSVMNNITLNGKLVYSGLNINPNFDINNSGGVNISDSIAYLGIVAGNNTTYAESGMILDAPWTGVSTSNSRFGVSVIEGGSIDASRAVTGQAAAYGDTWLIGNIKHGSGGVAALEEGIICDPGDSLYFKTKTSTLTIDGAGNQVSAISFSILASSFTAISDKTLKENIKPLAFSSQDLQTLNAYTYNFIADKNKKTKVGLIAQEVQDVLPDAVTTEKDKKTEETVLSLDYNAIVASLVSVINELTERVNELEVKTGIK